MINLLSIFVGGGIGSLLRHLVCLRIGSHWAVFVVNILGALFIGAAYEFFADKSGLRPELRSFVMTGLLGGFTTFPTYMLDFGTLLGGQRAGGGFLYLFGSLAVGAAFLFAGMKLARFCL